MIFFNPLVNEKNKPDCPRMHDDNKLGFLFNKTKEPCKKKKYNFLTAANGIYSHGFEDERIADGLSMIFIDAPVRSYIALINLVRGTCQRHVFSEETAKWISGCVARGGGKKKVKRRIH